MTVQAAPNKFTADGDGVTTTFPFTNLKLLENKDLEVFVDTVLQVEGVDYNLNYDENTQNGDVIFNTAPPAGTGNVLGIRDRELSQPFDIPVESDFDAEKIEKMVDNCIIIVQDQQDDLDRAVKLPQEYTGAPVETPLPDAGKILAWNDTEDGFVNSTNNLVDIENGLQQSVDDAAASAAAAAGSASAAAGSAANASSSASSASASAANAATSESNAATSASNAATSEANAAQSALDAQVAKIEWQGVYSAGTSYSQNDAVEFSGSSYISTVDSNLGNQPDVSPAQWDLLAAAGAGSDTLGGLSDVNLAGLQDGDFISYNNGTGEWEASSIVDASESQKGLVEIATDSEAFDGTGTGGTGAILALTPTNFTGTQSLATSGYQRLPGGLLIQWGQVTGSGSSQTIVFPIAFPNACFQVNVTGQNTGDTGGNDVTTVIGSSPTTTSFGISRASSESPIRWMAIGW